MNYVSINTWKSIWRSPYRVAAFLRASCGTRIFFDKFL